MHYNRLVTFGCSLTYGQALNDRHKESWPAQLGAKLNLPVDNQGRCGASAKRIWWQIVNYPFKQDDLVVIGWTHKDRWCIIKNPYEQKSDDDFNSDNPEDVMNFDIPQLAHTKEYQTVTGSVDIGPWGIDSEKASEMFYKYFHDDYDMTVNYFALVNHANYHLKEQKVKTVHLSMTEHHDNIPKFNKVNFLPIDFTKIRVAHPTADDNWHPGPEAFQTFSSKIYNHIKDQI